MAGGFCLLEGVSSLILFVGKMATTRTPAFKERLHTRYDPDIGWVHRPSVSVPDVYGPGTYLTTNAQGFRGGRDVAKEPLEGLVRVVCSGDSFTLGYGVDDDHTWCHRLEEMDPRLETVNMGQGGYGIDQAYLWYARDGASFEHSILVFALITGDFYRMQQASFRGYGKPRLEIQEGKLIAKNVPVPMLRFSFPYRLRRAFDLSAGGLRSAELLRTIRERFVTAGARADPDDQSHFDAETWEVAAKVFETLQEMSRSRGRTLLVVYLPTGDDYLTNASDPWRERLRAESERAGFAYFDLVPALRDLPPRRMRSIFLPKGSAGVGHYDAAGHQWVADRLYPEMVRLEGIAARLVEAGRHGSPERAG